ncbi:response regulator, partial [Pseudomonas sp. MPR-AND1A]|uniref:response regulator n=1 Tax=Pseudomonas sp. MPR-AND1A TaxID=2070600 RepID=UPI000CCA7DB6
LRERLQKESYEVIWKQDAQSTRELLKLEKSLDLVILDVGLPDGSGYEIAEELRQKLDTPFLFVTAQSNAEHRLRGFELGAEE